jgi:hypothetical protein
MRRLVGALLVCLAVAACGGEEDVPGPTALPATPFPDAVLEVHCLADGTTTATPRVRPGPAGVPLRVVNETDGVRAVLLDGDRLSVTASQDAGTTVESVQPLPPGNVDVQCTAPGTAAEPATPTTPTNVEIVPAEGLWRPDTVECPEGDEVGVPAQAGWTAYPALPRDQLPEALRSRTRLAPEDQIQAAGYQEQENAPLVVVRDGRVVISATTVQVDGGGWDLGEVWGCESDGLLDLAAAEAEQATAAVESASAEVTALADVVEVRCTPDGPIVSTALVRPGPAGVPLHVVNDAGKPLYVTLQWEGGGRGDLVSEERDTVETLPPGRVGIACYDPEDPAQDPPSSPGYLERVGEFEIVDVDGVWVSDALQCLDDQQANASASFAEDAGQPREELPDALRTWLKLRPTDEIRSAGYPEQADAPLVVVRDGRVVARGSIAELENGWVVDSVDACTTDVPL